MANWRFWTWGKRSEQPVQSLDALAEQPKTPDPVDQARQEQRAAVDQLFTSPDPLTQLATYLHLTDLTEQDCRRLTWLINRVRFHKGWMGDEAKPLLQLVAEEVKRGGRGASAALGECLQGVINVRDIVLSAVRSHRDEQGFAADLAVLLRLHGCGVSVINAQGDRRYPTTASAQRPCRFTWHSNQCAYIVDVQPHPTIVGASFIKSQWLDPDRLPPDHQTSGRVVQQDLDTVLLLRDKEDATMGRRIDQWECFRRPVAVRRLPDFPIQDHANTGNIPRIGIRISRQGESILLRDLGSSKRSVTEFFDAEGLRWQSTYNPDRVPEEDEYTQGVCDIVCLDAQHPSLFASPPPPPRPGEPPPPQGTVQKAPEG